MRLPRDLSGDDLAGRLRRHFGYRLDRQKGSHMTLTVVAQDSEHSLTIPKHRYIRVGTLSAIVSNVAIHFGLTQSEVSRRLFGN
ncbi:MAG: type II toxin-antitoxin system HicA family toxin [Nitrospinae bacterium]|nr:type II toxin-antitoxin system HicA family toxin [Nitrospinota bacterium]